MTTTAASIAAGLEQDIRSGCLPPGARLPTHRDLAHRHGVALNTASHAMRLLAARGIVVGEVGRGSYVRAPGHIDAASFRIEPGAADVIDLGRNVMPLPGLAERFEAAARTVLRRERDALADYQPHAGRAADRAAGAAWLSRTGHLPNDPSRVVVCARAPCCAWPPGNGSRRSTACRRCRTRRPPPCRQPGARPWPPSRAGWTSS